MNKSILSLLRIISRIKTQDSGRLAKYEMNAVFKVAFTFILVLLISISKSFMFVLVVMVFLLAFLSAMKAADIVKILRASLGMALFTFVILLPATLGGNYFSCVMITSKVFATIIAVNILSRSTRWNAITSALKRFFVPDLFIFVLDITIKYIIMLGDFALNMLYALKLRSVGRNKGKYASFSGIGGTLFIKSKEMSDEMYHAMECRGFTGEYHVHKNFGFNIADLAYIIVNMGFLFLFIYFERI